MDGAPPTPTPVSPLAAWLHERDGSGHHDDVTALENNILLQVPAFPEISIAKWNGILFFPHSPHDFDIVFRSKWGESTGKTERLQHVGVMTDQVLTRFIHSPDDIDLVTDDFRDCHGNIGIRNILCQPLREVAANVLDRSIFGLDIADERKRKHPVRTDDDFSCQLFILPHRYQQDI